MGTGIRISDSAHGTEQSLSLFQVLSKMGMSEDELIHKTKLQLKEEAAATSDEFSGTGLDLHPALEPVPDDDWEGGTWGLFWPDLEEFEELKENPEKYIKKHYEDKTKATHPPANLKADISFYETLTAPEKEKPVVVAATVAAPALVAAPAPVVLRPKKQEPVKAPQPIIPVIKEEIPIPCPAFEPVNVDNDNSKWSWMRSEDKSAGRARFSLSIYW